MMINWVPNLLTSDQATRGMVYLLLPRSYWDNKFPNAHKVVLKDSFEEGPLFKCAHCKKPFTAEEWTYPWEEECSKRKTKPSEPPKPGRIKRLLENPWTYAVLFVVIAPMTPPVVAYLGLLYLSVLLSKELFSAAIPEQPKTIKLIARVATVLQWILTLIFVCIILATIVDRGFRWFFLGF